MALGGRGPQEPIRIGLIAGLSDRGSDFGESVRNGVILAVEQQNQAGGIKGRKIELIVRDDGQNAEQARRAARELIDLPAGSLIGPATSSMAAVVVPMMNEAQLTLISPTATSPDFHGKDDRFFRAPTARPPKPASNTPRLRDELQRVGIAFDASNPHNPTLRGGLCSTPLPRWGGESPAASAFPRSPRRASARSSANCSPASLNTPAFHLQFARYRPPLPAGPQQGRPCRSVPRNGGGVRRVPDRDGRRGG